GGRAAAGGGGGLGGRRAAGKGPRRREGGAPRRRRCPWGWGRGGGWPPAPRRLSELLQTGRLGFPAKSRLLPVRRREESRHDDSIQPEASRSHRQRVVEAGRPREDGQKEDSSGHRRARKGEERRSQQLGGRQRDARRVRLPEPPEGAAAMEEKQRRRDPEERRDEAAQNEQREVDAAWPGQPRTATAHGRSRPTGGSLRRRDRACKSSSAPRSASATPA